MGGGTAMRFLIFVALIFTGCGSLVGLDSQTGLVNHELTSESESPVRQHGGRDVMNVSPTIAISGGGLLLFFVMLAKIIRLRQVVRIMVLSIEEVGVKELKSAISKKAFRTGVSDYVYRIVRREEKKK